MPSGPGTYGSKMGRPPKKKTGMMHGGMASKKKPMMNKGGAMKKTSEDQKGLKKLPTSVRNKMGYMAKGGMAKKKATKRGA